MKYLNSIFELDERFSEPIWNYYYNLESLLKYHSMTRDFITKSISSNKFYEESDWTQNASDNFDYENTSYIDGDAWEHQKEFIPNMQTNIIICMSMSLVETLLDSICKEIDSNRIVSKRGSYIQEKISFLKKNNGVNIDKKYLKIFEVYGHIRNSFIHQLSFEIPDTSKEYINKLTGPFSDIKNGINNTHLDILLSHLLDFGHLMQKEYWDKI